MPGATTELLDLTKAVPRSPLGKIRCSRDRNGYHFQFSQADLTVERHRLIASVAPHWQDFIRTPIPLEDIHEIKAVPLERNGRPWIGIQILHAAGITTLPVRGISQTEIEWMLDHVRECMRFEASVTQLEHDEALPEIRPHQTTSIVNDNGRTVVRVTGIDTEQQFEVSGDELTLRVSGWCETRSYTWPANEIFDLRQAWTIPQVDLVLFLNTGQEVHLAKQIESTKLKLVLETLRTPLRIPPITERSRRNLKLPIDPMPIDELPDPPFVGKRELSYARTPADAPVTAQADGSFSVFFPAASFWHAWIFEFIRALPAFIILQCWFGAMNVATRRFFFPVLAIQVAICAITFLVVAAKAYRRSVRLIVSDGVLTREMEAQYTHSFSHWPCEKIRELQVKGLNLVLLLEPQNTSRDRSDPVLVSYQDKNEVTRIAGLLRAALGLTPVKQPTAAATPANLDCRAKTPAQP